jgi:beta-N-acetylhexosaminidase
MTLGPVMMDLLGTELSPEERELLQHPLVGSVILFTRNYRDPVQLAELVAAIQATRSPAPIIGVDQEGGRVQRFRSGFSLLPPARRLGHEFDREPRSGLDWARELGWLMAAELRAVGIDLSFAPCVDLDYGISEVIGDRALHARAGAVGQLAVAWMHGMRDAGMVATAKHFPGHGAVVADSHLQMPVDRRALVDMEADLAPYRLLIENGLAGVMVSHVVFPELDSLPASLSPRWIRGVLREELRFQGAVFADDLSMKGAAAAVGDVVERSRLALEAGCDVLPICNDRASVLEVLRRLEVPVDPAAAMRRARLRGRPLAGAAQLRQQARWLAGQELLARAAAPPPLTLQA